jgi:ferritin
MNSRIEDAINSQIQAEFQSAWDYLSMSARLEELNFRGAAQWMRLQWEEETAHAMKFFDFMIRRGGHPRLRNLVEPTIEFDTPLEAFRHVYSHEQHVTQLIHGLYDLAVTEKDYPLQTLLHWFIDEQVEEEEAAEEIIQNLLMAGDSGQGLFLIDRELGQRTAADEA